MVQTLLKKKYLLNCLYIKFNWHCDYFHVTSLYENLISHSNLKLCYGSVYFWNHTYKFLIIKFAKNYILHKKKKYIYIADSLITIKQCY